MTIQIGAGPASRGAMVSSVYLSDDAYSLVEPILVRVAPRYHPDTRWGIGEFSADVWREVVEKLKLMAQRLEAGGELTASDIAWVHTVDLDTGVETDAGMFLDQLNASEARKAVAPFLLRLAEWIHDQVRREGALTIYGY
ncbi:MAG: hypothetical protein JSR45_13790 [Proteobacteria bacterium]|nr:hypothetical protein [Pseudomonadota bacterium]